MKTKQLTVNAMLAAMCAVLGYLAIDLGAVKITFETLPVIIAGLIYGPLSAVIVGGIGTFLYQILRYGFTVTTVLWMLPCMAAGLIAGICAKRSGYYNSKKQLAIITVVCEFAAFIFNTIAIYADAKIFGYFQPGLISGAILVRFLIVLAKSVIYSIIMLPILTAVAKYTHKRKK